MFRMLLLLIFLSTAPWACGSDDGGSDDGDEEMEMEAELGEGECRLNEHCPPNYFCVEGECIPSCGADGDCGEKSGQPGDVSMGTWFDSSSGLTWQNPPGDDQMEWQTAIDYCNDLSLDGHSDWRLPTISELRSLIRGCPETETGGSCQVEDDCLSSFCFRYCTACTLAKGPADGCYWPDAMEGMCAYYWSSQIVEDTGRHAWTVLFIGGLIINMEFAVNHTFARCVR